MREPIGIAPSIETSVAVHPLISSRVTARRLDPDTPVSETDLAAMLEAARLAPSAYNHQPWRFVVMPRGSTAFVSVLAGLADYNAVWAKDAALFIIGIAELAGEDGSERPWALYDLGQATAQLSLEATSRGLSVCQMAGVSDASLSRWGDADGRLVPQIVSAIGHPLGWRPLDGEMTRHRLPLARIAREL